MSISRGSNRLNSTRRRLTRSQQQFSMECTLKKHLLLLAMLFWSNNITDGNLTSVCGTSDSYWEVSSKKQNNTFTCTGLSAQDTVEWQHWEPSATIGIVLGECPPLTADGNEGANISCTVQFRNDTWSVFGQCSTERVYSAQNRYRCEWIQIEEPTREEILLANVSMSTVPSVGIYVNGSCNFTSYLPPEGQYTYHVTVVPGEVKVTASFIGSDVIRRSLSTPYHNCPQYVQEGGAVNCKCFISDPGSPPGELQWNTSLSSELRLSNVQSFDYGMYICQLLWNNTVVQSVKYVLKKGYSATVPTFNINDFDSKTVNVDEKSHVEIKCYSDGKPKPSSRLINAAEPSQFLNQSQPAGDDVDDEQSGEVSFSIHQVQCQASGVYRCDVNNSIGQDSESRTLLVSCAPKKTNINGSPPTVNVTNGSGVLIFNMTAYPPPEIKTLTYLGTNDSSDGHPGKENSIYAACSNNLLAPASVTCNVIVVNMTHNDDGFYKIVFSNSLGDLPFIFIVKVLENDQQAGAITKTDEKIAGVVVLAVVLSIVVVLILVTVIWVWRRGWTLPCADGTNQRNTQENQGSSDTSQHSLTPVSTNALSTTEGRATPLYDALQMKDVGKQSHYEGILRQQNVSEISSYEDVSSRMTRNEPTYMN